MARAYATPVPLTVCEAREVLNKPLEARMSERRSLRVAITKMLEDGFSPEEIVIGLRCERSDIWLVLPERAARQAIVLGPGAGDSLRAEIKRGRSTRIA